MIKTDQPQAQLYLSDGEHKISESSWMADRRLAETINQKIDELVTQSHKSVNDLEGLAVFSGPGSFTGLRIGHSVANALAYSLNIPIVGEVGDDWIEKAALRLKAGDSVKLAMPVYGSPAKTTKPKK